MVKKNPFKMWGSWIGAIIFLLLIFVALNSKNTGTITGNKAIYESAYFFPSNLIFHYGTNTYPFPDFTNVLIFPSQVIFGFLVGWGIERLARKNKWFGLR